MSYRPSIICLLVFFTGLFLVGCIPEKPHSEVMGFVLEYKLNTIPTVVFYTGSDEDYDYFYIDVPLRPNHACKVKRTETLLEHRTPVTKDKSTWSIYNPIKWGAFTYSESMSQELQKVFHHDPEQEKRVWVMSSEWAGYMGVAIGLSSNQYYYWFYSDVTGVDEPEYPVVGEYTLEEGVLTLLGSNQLYSSTWLVTMNSERVCLWAERDVGDRARLLIPDARFDIGDPFANQVGLKSELEPMGTGVGLKP